MFRRTQIRKQHAHIAAERLHVLQIFCAPSFDDKILEVVAVFGSMQMAVSRVIKLQHHRIAQVRTRKGTHMKKKEMLMLRDTLI